MKKISIIIPAHNEEKRIERTMRAYHQFFLDKQCNHFLTFEIVIVLNACSDNTIGVVKAVCKDVMAGDTIVVMNLVPGGKGFAIKAGFANALTRNNDLIGFVDADMATTPEAFYDLVENIDTNDGIIASRYMPGAQVFPPRPAYKRWGSRLIYEPLVKLLFGLSYYDLQCGAKLFTRATIAKITSYLTIQQWAFDVELLYLCKKFGFTIREIPTVWTDQEDSKLTLRAGLRMLKQLFSLRLRHSFFFKK
jgi:dolichol-phosphate mannosyltransferase